MKAKLRKTYRLVRKKIENKKELDYIIFGKLIKNSKVIESDIILIYVSNEEEINTINLIKYFLKNKKVAVPKIENEIMNFYFINSLDELSLGYFNILEPNTKNRVKDFSNCICITPGICFSKNGNRIGYGKGFYDKFFRMYNVYSIGLCYKNCLIESFKTSEFDEKVDEIITD